MRYIRYAFLALLAICLITVAMANRDTVVLNLLPADMAGFSGFSYAIELPLFVVIFGGVIAGLLIGFVWEWFREHRIRSDARAAKRSVKKLEREVDQLKAEKPEAGDDVLALLK